MSDRVANPDRVFFDFANASAAAAFTAQAREIKSALIKSVRIGRPTPGVTRVVFELTGTPRHSAFPLYGPFRLVVDLETEPEPRATTAPAPPATSPASLEGAQPAAGADVRAVPPRHPGARRPSRAAGADATRPPSCPARSRRASRVRATTRSRASSDLSVSRIVIDAGHGGHDPGANANGLNESELVLDVAHRLRKLLTARPGFDVVLTRQTDEFIPLEERTAIANREGADLFLSIHANASRQTAARGVETYILNFATNPAAEEVAARRTRPARRPWARCPAILKAIALNNKLAESRELATILQTSLVRKLRMQNKGLRDLGVKQAPFVVLIGAQMPSVLAEISFLTNKSEAAPVEAARPTASTSPRRSAMRSSSTRRRSRR